MKKIIIIFTLVLISNITTAQNVTMAKAFYKKAQKEYENKNYKEVINLLEKTVTNLNGETNPDIIYLEAKSRYENDTNINKAKTLFNQFLREADQNDGRIDEVSSILADIETSNNYYGNGNKKLKVYFEQDSKKIIEYNTENGVLYMFETYKDGELATRTNMMYKDNVFMAQSKLNLEPSSSKNYTFEFTDGLVKNIYFYSEKPKEFITKKVNLKLGEMVFNEIEFPVDKPSSVFILYNNDVRQYYSFNADGVVFYMFKEFKNWDENKDLAFCYSKKYESKSEIISFHFNGFVKEIYRENYGSSNWMKDERFFFNEDGWPLRQEKSKNGRLKEVLIFDKTTKSWSGLKKKDW